MATSDTESSDNEVIYDLTSEARARSAMSSRPASRSIAVQTDTMPHKKSCTKVHHRRQKSADNTIKEVRILEHETVRKAQSNPNMLTIGKFQFSVFLLNLKSHFCRLASLAVKISEFIFLKK